MSTEQSTEPDDGSESLQYPATTPSIEPSSTNTNSIACANTQLFADNLIPENHNQCISKYGKCIWWIRRHC